MEKFSVSVNIAAKSGVTFILTYEELLERKLGQYEILIRVRPQQPVQEFQVEHNLLLYFSYQSHTDYEELKKKKNSLILQNDEDSFVNTETLCPHLICLSDFVYMHVCVRVCVCVWRQILADIYEPQGIAFVNPTATFLTNELLSLVEKTVTDTKVKGSKKIFFLRTYKNCMMFFSTINASSTEVT